MSNAAIKRHLAAIGRKGGKAKSQKKAAAVRKSGKLGGRPSKRFIAVYREFLRLEKRLPHDFTAPLRAELEAAMFPAERARIEAEERAAAEAAAAEVAEAGPWVVTQ